MAEKLIFMLGYFSIQRIALKNIIEVDEREKIKSFYFNFDDVMSAGSGRFICSRI